MADEVLAQRVREVLAGLPVTEKRMFGGICFLLNGNMIGGASHRGLMLRVGKERGPALLAEHGGRPMEHGGRSLAGFIYAEPASIASDHGLRTWVDAAVAFVGTLPAKDQASPRPRRTKG